MKREDIPYFTSGIYRILFNNTDKSYIGLSNNIRRRITEHCHKDILDHPELPISKAILKHGIKDIEILEYIPAEERKILCEREKYWIQYYRSLTTQNGYNVSIGGDGANTGTNNPASKISEDELQEIIQLLKNTQLTFLEIGNQYNLNRNTISSINQGKTYYNESNHYPIRKNKQALNNKHSTFYNNEEKLHELIQTIKTSPQKTLAEIAKEYNISYSLISNINTGKRYKLDSEIYPIRSKNTSFKRIFDEKEIQNIYNDLANSTLTMKDIGKKYSCDSKVISDLNTGKRQAQQNQTYPIRTSRRGISSLKPNPVQTISGSGE